MMFTLTTFIHPGPPFPLISFPLCFL